MQQDAVVHLVKAIADCAVFFEFCDDDQLDPELAVQALEQIAANLGGLDASARDALFAQFEAIFASYRNEDIRDFVKTLPDTLGLRDAGASS